MEVRPTLGPIALVFVLTRTCVGSLAWSDAADDVTMLLQATSQLHDGSTRIENPDKVRLRFPVTSILAAADVNEDEQATYTQTEEEEEATHKDTKTKAKGGKDVRGAERKEDTAAKNRKGTAELGMESGDVTSKKCPCLTPESSTLEPSLNITSDFPSGVEMKHAGWTTSLANKGLGLFAARAFKKGEKIGSAQAKVVPCGKYTVHTPIGEWVAVCPIHFYSMPKCNGNPKLDEKTGFISVGVFPSWMAFLNGHAEKQGKISSNTHNASAGSQTGANWRADISSHPKANVEFGDTTCRQHWTYHMWVTREHHWHLRAADDIAKGEELLLRYDWQSSSSDPIPEPNSG